MKKIFIVILGAGFIFASTSCVNKLIHLTRNYPAIDVNEFIRPEFRFSEQLAQKVIACPKPKIKNIRYQPQQNKAGSIQNIWADSAKIKLQTNKL